MLQRRVAAEAPMPPPTSGPMLTDSNQQPAASNQLGTNLERRQRVFDLLPLRFQPRRQHEVLAKRRDILIHREPRTVGRDLEQHAAGFEEVYGLEPEPVDHLRRPALGRRDALAHRELGVIVRHAPGDVVDATRPPRSAWLVRHRAEVEVLARTAAIDPVATPAILLAHHREAERVDQKARGLRDVALPQPHRVETADLVLWWNWALRPRGELALVRRLDERELQPVRVGQSQGPLAVPDLAFSDVRGGERQAVRPVLE